MSCGRSRKAVRSLISSARVIWPSSCVSDGNTGCPVSSKIRGISPPLGTVGKLVKHRRAEWLDEKTANDVPLGCVLRKERVLAECTVCVSPNPIQSRVRLVPSTVWADVGSSQDCLLLHIYSNIQQHEDWVASAAFRLFWEALQPETAASSGGGCALNWAGTAHWCWWAEC